MFATTQILQPLLFRLYRMPDARFTKMVTWQPLHSEPQLGTLDFYIGRSARADLKGRRAPLPLAPLPLRPAGLGKDEM